MTTSYTIDHDDLTVTVTQDNGERDDLNATGEPCQTLDDLRDFVRELHDQGAYDAETRDRLLADIGED